MYLLATHHSSSSKAWRARPIAVALQRHLPALAEDAPSNMAVVMLHREAAAGRLGLVSAAIEAQQPATLLRHCHLRLLWPLPLGQVLVGDAP